MDEQQKTREAESDRNFQRKLRTVKFLSLGIVLFLVADIIGKWFLPEGADVPYLFTAVVWCVSIILGVALYFCFHSIRKRSLKTAALLVLYLVFLGSLIAFRFFRLDNPNLVGYRISAIVLPFLGIVICMAVKRIVYWYGIGIKKLFKLETTHSALFIGAFAVLGAVAVMLFIVGYRMKSCLGQQGIDIYQLYTEGEINHNKDYAGPFRRYDTIFNDLNEIQLEAARTNGLKEAVKEDEIEDNRQLQLIETNRFYVVDKLTHSSPYLVPKAAELVEDIGRAFQDSLFNRGYNRNHRITVTSVLRTQEMVRELQKSNVNSSENSCHVYGTTVDISYLTFDAPEKGRTASQEKMRQVLMEVMYDLRNSGRCYVKYEKKQTCLHITVR